ncbi:cytochrome b-c1 complex subunit 10-like [Ctenocephalides felis]|uniref:cytochrome b-c1 complex subunit 10-like n=1 Tax=Ctenocephalides felis TaxID=7515 RepID=UPI000E6E5053|nr:cytochrome b-c1 complex subunit 10-like [Ctenocephalides felis]
MSILRKLGSKHIEQAKQWVGTSAGFGLAGAYALCYFTDWKLVLQYLPYYNGKYKDQ